MKKVVCSVLVLTFLFAGFTASAADNPQTRDSSKNYRMMKSMAVQKNNNTMTRTQIFMGVDDFATKEECQAEIKKQRETNPTDESSYECKRIDADGLLDPTDFDM